MFGMKKEKSYLTINLIGQETEDGRIYVNSPDLEGFHFVLNMDEDPFEAMAPTLIEFMRLYIQAEIRELALAVTPKEYRRKLMDIPAPDRGSLDYTMVAELA